MDPSLHYARRARGHEPFYLKRLLFADFWRRGAIGRRAIQAIEVGARPVSNLPPEKGGFSTVGVCTNPRPASHLPRKEGQSM
jgi:hypothetical protein